MSFFDFKGRNKKKSEEEQLIYKKIPMTPELLQRKYEEDTLKKYDIRKSHKCDTDEPKNPTW